METVVTTAVMRASDSAAIAALEDHRALMRRAGEAMFASHNWQGPVAVVAGKGNNAGDGYVLALCLQNAGIAVEIILLADAFSADGRYFFDCCVQQQIPFSFFGADTDLTGYREIADCLLGTGFSGTVTGDMALLIEKINRSGAYVVSADINSGLNGDTGMKTQCVRSDLTVSIGFLKLGHILNMARDCIARLVNCNIGIALRGEGCLLPSPKDFQELLIDRPHFSHKGIWGYVTLIGGCLPYSGAAKLANMSAAALRAGCGVARLAVPSCITDGVMPYLLESTLYPMPDRNGYMTFDPAALDAALCGVRAVAVGMGWGAGEDNEKTLRYLLDSCSVTLIIDADGLNTLARMDLSVLKSTKCRVILTPHLKEFERLCGVSTTDAMQSPVKYAQAFAKEYGVFLLLKGTASVITDGDTTMLVNAGSGGMATAGSGDVLSGILCGLHGYLQPSVKSTALGAWIAGRAGEKAAAEMNPVSMVASDTIRYISAAVGEILDAAPETESQSEKWEPKMPEAQTNENGK